jgi:hypothetical protein
VLAFSDIIGFLFRLLTDEAARAEFDQDPRGTLDRAGLEGVTAQDIRDARLQLADSGATHAVDGGGGHSPSHGDDPVREIHHTTTHYTADHDHAPVGHDGATFLTIDDRDTLFFQSISDDDVTVTDNSVAISDSFNEDNSQRNLVAIQDNDTTVSDDDVTIEADNSFNEDNDQVAIQDNDVDGGDEAMDVDVNGPVEPVPPPVEADDAPDPQPAEIDAPADVEDDATDDATADDGADLATDDALAL